MEHLVLHLRCCLRLHNTFRAVHAVYRLPVTCVDFTLRSTFPRFRFSLILRLLRALLRSPTCSFTLVLPLRLPVTHLYIVPRTGYTFCHGSPVVPCVRLHLVVHAVLHHHFTLPRTRYYYGCYTAFARARFVTRTAIALHRTHAHRSLPVTAVAVATLPHARCYGFLLHWSVLPYTRCVTVGSRLGSFTVYCVLMQFAVLYGSPLHSSSSGSVYCAVHLFTHYHLRHAFTFTAFCGLYLFAGCTVYHYCRLPGCHAHRTRLHAHAPDHRTTLFPGSTGCLPATVQFTHAYTLLSVRLRAFAPHLPTWFCRCHVCLRLRLPARAAFGSRFVTTHHLPVGYATPDSHVYGSAFCGLVTCTAFTTLHLRTVTWIWLPGLRSAITVVTVACLLPADYGSVAVPPGSHGCLRLPRFTHCCTHYRGSVTFSYVRGYCTFYVYARFAPRAHVYYVTVATRPILPTFTHTHTLRSSPPFYGYGSHRLHVYVGSLHRRTVYTTRLPHCVYVVVTWFPAHISVTRPVHARFTTAVPTTHTFTATVYTTHYHVYYTACHTPWLDYRFTFTAFYLRCRTVLVAHSLHTFALVYVRSRSWFLRLRLLRSVTFNIRAVLYTVYALHFVVVPFAVPVRVTTLQPTLLPVPVTLHLPRATVAVTDFLLVGSAVHAYRITTAVYTVLHTFPGSTCTVYHTFTHTTSFLHYWLPHCTDYYTPGYFGYITGLVYHPLQFLHHRLHCPRHTGYLGYRWFWLPDWFDANIVYRVPTRSSHTAYVAHCLHGSHRYYYAHCAISSLRYCTYGLPHTVPILLVAVDILVYAL